MWSSIKKNVLQKKHEGYEGNRNHCSGQNTQRHLVQLKGEELFLAQNFKYLESVVE